MMFDLILAVINGFYQLRDAHTESATALLPAKVVQLSKSLVIQAIWACYRFVGNSALEWPEPFPQLRVQHRRTLFGAENAMNIERARGVGHGRLCSGITLGSGSINLHGKRIILVVFDTHQSKG